MVGKRMSQQKQTGERWRPWILVALGTSLIAALTLFARPAVLKVVGGLNENRTQRAQEFSSLKIDTQGASRLPVLSRGSSSLRAVTPQSPQYQGFHDGAGCNTISGWAWDLSNPNTTVSVDIYDGTEFIATASANMYREDLLNALGSPNHGFSYPTPAALKDGAFHTVNVKFSGTSTLLSNTGRTAVCASGPNLTGRLDGAGCNAIEGWAWDSNDSSGTVNVDIYNGATLIGTVAATLYRQDLADTLGSPYHGFIFHTPASLKDGQPHVITVKYGGTSTPLPANANPFTFVCSSHTTIYQGSLDVADCSTISGYAWDTQDDGGTINAAIYVDGGFYVVVPAQELYSGIGGGYHGFKFATPPSMKDGQTHSVQVKYSGTTTTLSNTAKTITCTIGPQPGGYEGFLDGAYCSVIGGWAWNSNQPNSAVNVDIYDGSTLLTTLLANQFRQDLLNAGKGNGYHGYNLATPSILKDGQQHTIRVKLVGTTTDLNNSPQSLTCTPPPVNFSNALIDPINRTGVSGEDLFSGNYNWSLPILGLTGRAGLDLGLSMTYNSLVWTKSGSSMGFDLDKGFPSAGFRLGFPAIQQQTYTSQSGAVALLLLMPSGQRVELRQVSATLFESADGSWLQLDTSVSPMILRTSDGAQLSFQLAGGDYKCTQVKDRNGNYITINYDTSGHISTVKDTLNRTITFVYSNNNLQKITQLWNGTDHLCAQFEYNNLTIQTSFSGLSIVGPQNGASITVLSKVTLGDSSYFTFDYSSYAQVKKISHYAVDNHLLASTAYDMNTSAGQTDCPRFTMRSDYAENWNTVNTSFTFDRGAGSGSVTTPDLTLTKETHSVSGYNKGLTTQVDTYSSDNLGTAKKTTVITWTQDNTGISYPLNPRVTETNVYDDKGNRRRSTISYSTLTLPSGTICSLRSDIREYASDGATVLRKTHTDYVTTSSYLNQHIIGLPSARCLYDSDSQAATPLSKVTFGYDAGASLTSQGDPVQHDSSYGTGFTTRGNSTSIARWDVTTLGNQTPQSVTSTISYNTAGDVISTSDPLSHQVTISYTDSFAATATTLPSSTLAYPTTVTDADSKSSSVQYDYDLGIAKVTTDPKNATLTKTFDGAGRVLKIESNLMDSNNNKAYTRFAYPQSMTEVDTYILQSTVPTVEIYSAQFLDGAGRVISTRRELPGSTGGYSGQKFVYDVMGRVSQQSNPTEIDVNGTPKGDDQTAGWLYTTQTYDWKGRPLVTTNTDTTTRTVTYGGCGCAGGEVVTAQDEVGRQQRMTHDVLGRLAKTEVLNMDQNHTVYSTTSTSYNARDQLTLIRQYQGDSTSTTFQDTVMSYDGHGRLSTRKAPAEDSATTYAYYSDDTVQTVTDPRGASSTFTYNGRHLVTGITYAKPGNSPQPDAVTPVPSVAFGYDDAGNRLWMTDGLGRVDYAHDTWSRLTSEARYFSDLNQTFTISYEYDVAGELKKLTDAFSSKSSYGYNQAGQLTSVAGSGPNSVPSYISQIGYRAWGAPKQIAYGNGVSTTMSYNSRLQVSSFNIPGLMGATLSYYSDGRIHTSQDTIDRTFDRAYNYDQVGRMREALTGSGAGLGSQLTGPYHQSYDYDAFGNMTSR